MNQRGPLSECRLRVTVDYDYNEYVRARTSPQRKVRKNAKNCSRIFRGRCCTCGFDLEISYPGTLDSAIGEFGMLHLKFRERLTTGVVT